MKILNLLALIFSGLILITSCREDPDEFEISSENLLEITAEADVFSPDAEIYIWLTASDGSIIGKVEMESGMEVNIKSPEGFSDDRFCFHMLYYYESDGDYTLYSRNDMKRGMIQFRSRFFDFGETQGEMDLSFTDVPPHTTYFIDYGPGRISGNEIDDISIRVYENSGWFYLCLKDEGFASYKFVNDIEPNVSRMVSLVDLNSDMADFTIDFGNTGWETYSIYAYAKAGNYYSRRTLLANEYHSNDWQSQVEFQIPRNIGRFEDIGSYSRSSATGSDVDYYYRTYGFIPESFKQINAHVSSVDFNGTDYVVNATGEFDRIDCSFSSYDQTTETSARWSIINESGGVLEFPQIPASITSMYPDVSKERLVNNETYYSIYLDDIADINSYDEYLDRTYHRKGKGLLDGITEAAYVRFSGNFGEKKASRPVNHELRDFHTSFYQQ